MSEHDVIPRQLLPFVVNTPLGVCMSACLQMIRRFAHLVQFYEE